MKSDKKVIEYFRENIANIEFKAWNELSDLNDTRCYDHKKREFYNLTDVIEEFILKTRREAVEEAFKAIRIEDPAKRESEVYETIHEDANGLMEAYMLGADSIIGEINRKKEEFLREK